MKETDEKLLQLLNKQKLSIDDRQWLLDYIENTDQKELFELLKRDFNSHINGDSGADIDFSEQILTDIYTRAGIQPPKKFTIKYLWVKRLAFASAFAGLFLAIFWGALHGKKSTVPQHYALTVHHFKNDVAPGGNKAILTLSNGKKIILNSVKNGVIANQGSSMVIKAKNGELVYNSANQSQHELVFNTIATPRGGHYQVVLPDGSQAWLNAASSIRFPTSFANSQKRVVEITGEAYFEVAKNKEKPFVVKANNSEIQVLGTHFNVNAYTDEAIIKTTLLEGSVRFSTKSSQCMLKPGQQSQLNKDGKINVIPDADVESAMAWKNGMLHFEDVDINFVMRQLSRWYDIDVVYLNNNKTSDHFFVELSDQSKLSDVLRMMELTGRVSFDIQGKIVFVK